MRKPRGLRVGCQTVTNLPAPPVPSKGGACDLCAAPVWIADTTTQLIARIHASGLPSAGLAPGSTPEILCLECAVPRIQADVGAPLVTSNRQLAEVADHGDDGHASQRFAKVLGRQLINLDQESN